jgi:hypothetical protein
MILFLRLIILAIGIFLACSYSSCNSGDLVINPEPLSIEINKSIDTSAANPSKNIYYLVMNFNGSIEQIAKIDEFYCASLDSLDFYLDYHVYFFKESSRTNFKHLNQFPKDIIRYSIKNDIILSYEISAQNYFIKRIFTDGNNEYTSIITSPCKGK